MTYAVGIDHGTSNSAIALMESSGPRVIKVDGVNDTMPSKVYISAQGRQFVGRPAYEAAMNNALGAGTSHPPYKTHIGDGVSYSFPRGKSLSGVELGGIIIGELLSSYEAEVGERPKSAVITVPAKFKQPDVNATQEAARLAGLERCPTIQEPIAAALAYGFSSAESRAQWLVFDLGGGTLDVSLVILRDGVPVVPEAGHGGDNDLGGGKFDRELLGMILSKLASKYGLANFGPRHDRYGHAYSKLLLAVERAKIELSRAERAVVSVDGVLCKDDSGKDVLVELEVRRSDYEALIAADVQRALNVCRQTLARSGLQPKDVHRLILVGGPTKTPYIQHCLQTELKIPLEASIDPMTAVVQGAAIHALTKLGSDAAGLVSTVSSGEVDVTLSYEPGSREATAPVLVRATRGGAPARGLRCSLRRSDGGWARDEVTNERGEAEIEVGLIASPTPRENTFVTRVLDDVGRQVGRADGPKIWHPLPDAAGRLASSVRVGLRGNETQILMPAGVSLPGRGAGSFVTAKTIEPGMAEDVLRIPLVEGLSTLLGEEDGAADSCLLIGSMVIGGRQKIARRLPQGSTVEVEIEIDASRHVTMRAYVELLDEEFEGTFEYKTQQSTTEEIGRRLEGLAQRLAQVQAIESQRSIPRVREGLEILRKVEAFASLEKEWERAKAGEEESRFRADKRARELVGTMNVLERLQTPARAALKLEHLRPLTVGDRLEQLDDLSAEVGRVSEEAAPEVLSRIDDRVSELELELVDRYLHVLRMDHFALPEVIRGTQAQLDVVRRAEKLLKEVDALREAHQPVPPDKVRALAAAHEELMERFPELSELRRRALETLGSRVKAGASESSDLRRSQA